jgi:A/G-specific adenine glycosylase
MPRPSSKFDLAIDPGKDHASVLRRQLLTWWQAHGRKDLAQKPWMVAADGCWPLLEQALDPYGVLVAEVMLISTA